MRRKIVTVILVLTIIFTGQAAAYADALENVRGEANPVTAAGQAGKEPYDASGLYSVMSTGRYDIFTNYVHGYELFVDMDMQIDMDYSAIVTVLENETKRIEIYKQNIAKSSVLGYIDYSNAFLSDTVSHYSDYNDYQTIGDYNVKVTSWQRNKLSNVENDKNYYLSLEIPQGQYVYTIFIKSQEPIDESGGYTYLVENFKTFYPGKSGTIRTSEAIDISERGWNKETKEFYDTYYNEDAPLTWGIFEPDTDFIGYEQMEYYERYFNYQFPIMLTYSQFLDTSSEMVRSRLERGYDHGKIVELTLQTVGISGNMVYDILDGMYDDYIFEYADTIEEFGHPVLFRPFNEMNGDWCQYSSYHTSKDTLIFKELYRYLYNIFEERGANKNTIWVWNPNSVSYPNFDWNHALMYYPGDEYVDIVGMTAYNTGTYYPGEKWETFMELYEEMYINYCEWFSQPFMITEFSSSSVGGDKAAWMEDMFKQIKNFERIKVAIWWDGCDWDAEGNVARSYFLDESIEIMDAFREGIKIKWHEDVYA